MARRLTGLILIETASRPRTVFWVKEMHAHQLIDHRQPFNYELNQLGIPQVQYVVSLSNTEEYLPAIVKILMPQAKLVLTDAPKTLDISPLKFKSLPVDWEMMFTRSLFGTHDLLVQNRILNEVAELIDAGVLRTTVRADVGRINAASLPRAHAFLESGITTGKLVLEAF